MKTSNNKKTYQSPEATKYNMNMSTHVLIGSDASGFSITTTGLTGMGGFGGGYNPSMGD